MRIEYPSQLRASCFDDLGVGAVFSCPSIGADAGGQRVFIKISEENAVVLNDPHSGLLVGVKRDREVTVYTATLVLR